MFYLSEQNGKEYLRNIFIPVLNKLLHIYCIYIYINYIALAINPFLGPCTRRLAYLHLPMPMQWAGPMPRPMCWAL